MAIYGAIKIDKAQATDNGSLKSVQLAATPLENGFVFFADTLVTGQREIYQVVQPVTATLTTGNLLIHASVPTTYLAGDTIVNYVLAAGKTGRAFTPKVGDIYTITDANITGTSVLNQFLIPADQSFRLVPSATIGTTKFSAKVIEKGTLYGQTSTTIEIVKV
jgi:hypothetical protein